MPSPIKLDTAPTKAEVLDCIDSLRASIENGEIVAFAAVALCADDETIRYCGAVRPVTRLRTQGAIAGLLHAFIAGDI